MFLGSDTDKNPPQRAVTSFLPPPWNLVVPYVTRNKGAIRQENTFFFLYRDYKLLPFKINLKIFLTALVREFTYIKVTHLMYVIEEGLLHIGIM